MISLNDSTVPSTGMAPDARQHIAGTDSGRVKGSPTSAERDVPRSIPVSLWRETIAPKEHGSWSLAFEPMALGMLVAPSLAGALFAGALAAAFFARRPLKIAAAPGSSTRRSKAKLALLICGGVALTTFGGALALAGTAWLPWLLPMAITGAVFAVFDLRGGGREQTAEVAGATAFALAPAALAILAGWSPLEALALAALAVGRSLGSVMCVRAFLRGTKGSVRSDGPALVVSVVAVMLTAVLVYGKLLPWLALVAMVAFAMRSLALLVTVRPAWRARTVGMMEAALGVVFVGSLALAWS